MPRRHSILFSWRRLGAVPGFRPLGASLVSAGLLLGIAACTPTIDARGDMPDPEALAQVKVGVTTEDQVQSLLGTPSTTMTYGEDVWHYISGHERTVSFFTPVETDRTVISISFDKNGVVRDISRLGLKDGKTVDLVTRETPTAGKELSVLEQLVGNVGRFTKPEQGN
jgi:outer membrane protein assembly factor BamE (lipoprotein component of BamABCDE complex)